MEQIFFQSSKHKVLSVNLDELFGEKRMRYRKNVVSLQPSLTKTEMPMDG